LCHLHTWAVPSRSWPNGHLYSSAGSERSRLAKYSRRYIKKQDVDEFPRVYTHGTFIYIYAKALDVYVTVRLALVCNDRAVITDSGGSINIMPDGTTAYCEKRHGVLKPPRCRQGTHTVLLLSYYSPSAAPTQDPRGTQLPERVMDVCQSNADTNTTEMAERQSAV
jgi:hypothetical protein